MWLFIEFTDGFLEIDGETLPKSIRHKFIENEREARQEAGRLDLPWPVWYARNERACVHTVYEEIVEDWEEYARQAIAREFETRKNPPKASSCMCGILGHGCGCGPSCKCGE